MRISKERLITEGNPLIDGDQAIIIWLGDQPPSLQSDVGNWSANPTRLEEHAPGLWTYTFTLPQDAYIEYVFFDQDGNRLLDPYNPRMIPNGLGDTNHIFWMPEYKPTPLARRKPGIKKGQTTRYSLKTYEMAVGRERAVYLYQPPTEEPVPLLVVYDGVDFLRRGKITSIVDNLIAQDKIEPIALAMVANGKHARFVEYACSETTIGFITELVLPYARKHLSLLSIEENPGAYGVMGASMGGLMSVYTGLRAPHIFGKVLCQSGAFILEEYRTVAFDLVQYGPLKPVKIWMDTGRYEFLFEANLEFHRALTNAGYDVTYRIYNGGHNYTCWRNELAAGLIRLFGKDNQ